MRGHHDPLVCAWAVPLLAVTWTALFEVPEVLEPLVLLEEVVVPVVVVPVVVVPAVVVPFVEVVDGAEVLLCGAAPALGAWDPTKAAGC